MGCFLTPQAGLMDRYHLAPHGWRRGLQVFRPFRGFVFAADASEFAEDRQDHDRQRTKS